ncbi:MAG: nucleoid-associated protein [Pseudomonadota bacterium]
MHITDAIVHRIDKARHQHSYMALAKNCLPIDIVLSDAVEKARKTYGTTSNRAFGTFEANVRLFPFSGLLGDYLSGKLDMLKFSGQAMTLLVREMDKQALATGGYALFVSYEEHAKTFFMVVLLKLRGGTGIDEKTLTLNKNFSLDVDHLHEAARINVANWQAADGNYISFVKKGKSDADFTDYFRNFLGCAEFVESKGQTEKIVQVIREYCVASKLPPDEAKKLKEKAFNYFSEQARDGKTVSLAALSMRFDDQKPKAFLEYLEHNAGEIGDGFEPHKSSFRRLMRVGGKDADITINFDIGLIGNRVRYDKIKKELLIVDLPPSLIAALDSEI